MLNDMVSRRGAVRLGLEHATLCAAEAASSTASGGCAARGCEGDVWRSLGSVGFVYARGEGGVRSVGVGRAWSSSACSAWLLASWARSVRVV